MIDGRKSTFKKKGTATSVADGLAKMIKPTFIGRQIQNDFHNYTV